jgi:alkenylglycerophosphocholine/alkenylglycerophosphoethanolamine hydrolase
MDTSLTTIILLFLCCAAAAVYGVESRRPALVWLTKPVTTAMLFLVAGWPGSRFDWFVALGILLSLWGDVALLSDSARAFLIGLGLFLAAHICYIVAFTAVEHWSAALPLYALAVGAVSVVLVRRLWTGARGTRLPVLIYTAAISAMVITALGTRGGPLPPTASTLAGLGAMLFYVSDSSLALNRFYRPIPRVSVLTMGVYWLGQLGIALAARLSP